ncbi:MAG: hypothetical protein J5642_03690 [Bacteroidales bacterium]|nr:hypothetical protein [Bacteroidales bacterium]
MKDKPLEIKEKKSFLKSWKTLKVRSKIYQVFVHLFAIFGCGMMAAWGIYKLGLTNDEGGVDPHNRYLANYQQREGLVDSSKIYEANLENYVRLAALNKVFPTNAHLIYEASQQGNNPEIFDRMVYAADMYMQETEMGKSYLQLMNDLNSVMAKYPNSSCTDNVIPWMNDSGWLVLKKALVKDAPLIQRAAELTGVDARLIAACTVGEQIRLFNSKREDVKRYLGPAILSVQNTFSFGVNGIKDFTAAKVERNLKDSTSEFYMGKEYEHILDYDTAQMHDLETARYNRLVNYRDHFYSYVYTGCILHQTMLQWKRAGYDISDRPDILCTLFNLGFIASKPNPEPRCGGSRVSVNGRTYTFGVLGNDFFYSGELANHFPMPTKIFR